MNAARSGNTVIFVVMIALGIALIHSSFSIAAVFALPPDIGWGQSDDCKIVDPFDSISSSTD